MSNTTRRGWGCGISSCVWPRSASPPARTGPAAAQPEPESIEALIDAEPAGPAVDASATEALAALQSVLEMDLSSQDAYELWQSTNSDLWLQYLAEGGQIELAAKGLLDRVSMGRREKSRDEDAIRRRYDEARREIAKARESAAYDAFVVNDDLDRAQDEACALIRARLTCPKC